MLMRIPLDDTPDAPVMVVEVDYDDIADEQGVELVSDTGPGRTAQALRSLADSFDHLEPAVSAIVTRLRKAARTPDAITVEFGLKFGGETGVIFAKGKAEAALKVTVTWNGPEPVVVEEVGGDGADQP
ncbi:CU044_2847 family protein [Herbidospora daliensis]|uniref:CU044_2847 family protein n=1 Tax=Herbidospora daliensis TaxID=295585 RepID=UPI0007820829|nr:CU044_2847 family protein [Herbidospora daliensis]